MSYDHFSKNLKIDKTSGGFKKRSQAVSFFFIHINKFLSFHVWNDSLLHLHKKKLSKNIILNTQI